MRRGLGFGLTSFAPILRSLVDYLEAHDLDVVTVDAALAWATATPRSTDQVRWARRMMVARIFARHLAVQDPRTQIPPPDLLPYRYRRVSPYLFSDAEIARLLDAAEGLRPALRAATWHTLIGLLAVTGLRVGEACGLDRADVDLPDLLLTVHDSSSASTGWSRSIPAPPRRCVSTPTPATGDSPNPAPHGSCPAAAPGWTARTCPTPSPACCPPPGSARHQDTGGHGSPTCDTGSPPPRSWGGTATATTSLPEYPACPPTSGTWTRSRPTGTSPAHRSCSHGPRTGSNAT